MAENQEKRGVLSWYFKTNLLARILIGLVLGAIVGIDPRVLSGCCKTLCG